MAAGRVSPTGPASGADSWRDSVTIADECVTLLAGRRLGRLLDAGGGTGTLTGHVLRRCGSDSATVLDADPQVPRSMPGVLARRGRIEDLRAADGEFETILIRQVLHYVRSPVGVLRRLRGRLSDGGAVYIGQLVAPDPVSARWLGGAAGWVTPARQRVWTVGRLLAAMAHAGLAPDRCALTPHWQVLDPDARRDGLTQGMNRRGLMPVRSVDGVVCCRVFWVHAIAGADHAGLPDRQSPAPGTVDGGPRMPP